MLFADLSGYTAVSEKLDPEDTKALVDRVLGRLSREVVAHGGRVDKYIGDNVMAVFGAPVAHEDDPERAVRTGLAMQAAMSEINADIGSRTSTAGVEFALRVGVNTGEVLAGKSGEQYTVIGDAVNVAARLQSAGARGSVTVGPSTQRLTAGSIEYRELEPLSLKGKSEPIPAFEAVGIIAAPTESLGERASSPLVGRDQELALLTSRFDRVAQEARPHLVTVLGEAGVGKSRLLGELASELAERSAPAETLIGRSPAYGTATSYWALGEIIRHRFEITENEEPDEVLAKITARVAALRPDEDGAEAARIATQIGLVIGIGSRDEAREESDPEGTRDRIFAAVRLLLEMFAQQAPVVIAIEDVHWADEGMLDLIEHLAGWAQGPVLFVCLARDELLERRPNWGGGRRNATTISLDPLSGADAQDLVGSLFADRDLSPELIEAVAGRSGGNPLFAEEMVNRLGEAGDVAVDELPDSVHAVLAARLDALQPEERRLLQAASVVGQAFSEETLSVLFDGADRHSLLARLVDKDLIWPSGSAFLGGDSEFTFKHALIRDVAYATLPRAVRARQHSRVAGEVETRAGSGRDSVVALLAQHHGRAAELAEGSSFSDSELHELRVRAAEAFAEAGDVAASLYSNAEALAHYENALALPGALEDIQAAAVQESRADTSFRSGHVDQAIDAWARALDVRSAAEDSRRTAELHRKIGSGHWQRGEREASIQSFQQGIDMLKGGEPCRELVELYEEAASLYLETGDNMLAVYAAEKAQRLSESLGRSATASRANLTFGRVFGRIGDVERARQSLERSVELGREAGPGAAIGALIALGRHLEVAEADYPAAEAAGREALALAEEVGDVPAQIDLQGFLGQLAAHSAKWAEVALHGAAAAKLADREGLAGQLCLPLLLQGIHAWHVGDLAAAEDCLGQSHEIAAAGGRSETAFTALLWLGECKRDGNALGAADSAFAEAVAICDRASLTVQLIEASAARATVLAADDRAEEGRGVAKDIEDRWRNRNPHPVVGAAIAEADGATSADHEPAIAKLREAVTGWETAGRPLNAIRARIALARVLAEGEPSAVEEVLAQVARDSEHVGAPLLAVDGHRELRARDVRE